ncbi:MAG: hypothetical protein ACR2L1_10075 [Pyrinomonadaceae bacterium]
MFSHLIVSSLIALIYAVGFEYVTHASSWLIGAGFGIIHWLIAGVFMGIMSSMHPLMARGELAAPGFFAANFGIMSMVAFLVLHIFTGRLSERYTQRRMV